MYIPNVVKIVFKYLARNFHFYSVSVKRHASANPD